MNNLQDFITYELYPTLFNSLDRAFPSMSFQRRGGDWHSPYKLNGERSSDNRTDKSVVTRRYPNTILEQGGEAMSLIDFYLQSNGYRTNLKGAELVEALRSLCTSIGLTLPEGDTEEWRAYKERQEKLERAAIRMQNALHTPEGAATLRYLTEKRGYTVEDIKAMGLGHCTTEIASTIEGAPFGAGNTYTLAIPYRSGGRILGFKLRTIEDSVKPKYKNTQGLPKKASLFGLTGLKLTGNGEKDRDITIVEGELDALRAQIRGVENIVASAGLDVSVEAMEEAKRRGVKRVTILVDVEETEAAQKDKVKKIENAIRAIKRVGLKTMVAELPEGEAGEKVDVDSYLNNHTAEELQSVVDDAVTGSLYLYNNLYQQWLTDEDKSYKKLQDFKEATIAIMNDTELCEPTDSSMLCRWFEKHTNEAITVEALQAEANAQKELLNQTRQREQWGELLKKASLKADKGLVEESINLLIENAPEVRKIAKETEYRSLLTIPTAKSIKEKLQARPEGIQTGYVFSSKGREERLTLPSGAITLVAAPTSHGKSTFLRNLALEAVRENSEGVVLYFSFEEDMESTIVELLNTYAGITLTTPSRSYNNLTTIAEYYREGSAKYMKSGTLTEFREAEEAFMRDYIESGRLRIYDNDYSSTELVEAIKYIAAALPVKAVFIDYVQLLYKQGNRLQRNEELKEIAKELRQTAKALKLPIVLAAQLNRDAKSPVEMHSQNIADSADLEREANKVVLLWNSSFKPTNGNSYDETKLEIDKRATLGEGGYVYAKLSKNRGGIPSIDALFTFEGNTGRIYPNYKGEPLTNEPEVEEEDIPLF